MATSGSPADWAVSGRTGSWDGDGKGGPAPSRVPVRKQGGGLRRWTSHQAVAAVIASMGQPPYGRACAWIPLGGSGRARSFVARRLGTMAGLLEPHLAVKERYSRWTKVCRASVLLGFPRLHKEGQWWCGLMCWPVPAAGGSRWREKCMLELQDTDDARPVHDRKRKRKGERAYYVSQRICAWELGRVGFKWSHTSSPAAARWIGTLDSWLTAERGNRAKPVVGLRSRER